ncbi:hypothetical protein BRADI_4g43125v3, partial [Brachypodium distachyon]
MATGAARSHRRRAAVPDPFAELQCYDEQQMDRFYQQCARMTRRRRSSAPPAVAQRMVVQIRFGEDGCPEFSDGNGVIISSTSHDDDIDVGVSADGDGAYRGGGFGAVPASGLEIAKLAEADVGEHEEEEECAVCLEGLATAGEGEEKVVIRKMPCPDAHRFHERCIFRWLMVSRLCPLCRFALPPAEDEEE